MAGCEWEVFLQIKRATLIVCCINIVVDFHVIRSLYAFGGVAIGEGGLHNYLGCISNIVLWSISYPVFSIRDTPKTYTVRFIYTFAIGISLLKENSR